MVLKYDPTKPKGDGMWTDVPVTNFGTKTPDTYQVDPTTGKTIVIPGVAKNEAGPNNNNTPISPTFQNEAVAKAYGETSSEYNYNASNATNLSHIAGMVTNKADGTQTSMLSGNEATTNRDMTKLNKVAMASDQATIDQARLVEIKADLDASSKRLLELRTEAGKSWGAGHIALQAEANALEKKINALNAENTTINKSLGSLTPTETSMVSGNYLSSVKDRLNTDLSTKNTLDASHKIDTNALGGKLGMALAAWAIPAALGTFSAGMAGYEALGSSSLSGLPTAGGAIETAGTVAQVGAGVTAGLDAVKGAPTVGTNPIASANALVGDSIRNLSAVSPTTKVSEEMLAGSVPNQLLSSAGNVVKDFLGNASGNYKDITGSDLGLDIAHFVVSDETPKDYLTKLVQNVVKTNSIKDNTEKYGEPTVSMGADGRETYSWSAKTREGKLPEITMKEYREADQTFKSIRQIQSTSELKPGEMPVTLAGSGIKFAVQYKPEIDADITPKTRGKWDVVSQPTPGYNKMREQYIGADNKDAIRIVYGKEKPPEKDPIVRAKQIEDQEIQKYEDVYSTYINENLSFGKAAKVKRAVSTNMSTGTLKANIEQNILPQSFYDELNKAKENPSIMNTPEYIDTYNGGLRKLQQTIELKAYAEREAGLAKAQTPIDRAIVNAEYNRSIQGLTQAVNKRILQVETQKSILKDQSVSSDLGSIISNLRSK